MSQIPRGLVARIRRFHRRGPGSIPGVGNGLVFLLRTTVNYLIISAFEIRIYKIEHFNDIQKESNLLKTNIVRFNWVVDFVEVNKGRLNTSL